MKLKDKADVLVAKGGACAVTGAHQIAPQHLMCPRCGLHQGAQNGQKRAFTRARRPQKRRDLTRLQRQVQPAQHGRFGQPRAKGLDQILHHDKRAHWPIAVTGSTLAADRAGQIEARMAPKSVNPIANP